MADTKISAATVTSPAVGTDKVPIARVADTTARSVTVTEILALHTGDSADAHAASAITNTPAGNIAATTVQAAIDELDGDKQPLDAGLTDIAGLAVTDGNFIVGNGSNWVAESGATALASIGGAAASHTHSLADITDDGTIASQNANNVSISGGSIAGITDLAVADGGTGASDAATARDNLDVPHDLSVMYANRLINGEFRIWQRGTSLSAQADDAYTADRWYILTQTSTIADARQADPFDGATHSGQLTQSQVTAQRIGRAQIIEGKNCKDLRGQDVVFYGRFKISNDQDIRVAILENTGTEDTVTSDVVNDWTSTTYTASNFFIAMTVTAVKEYASPGTGWVDFFVTGTVSTSCDNIVVFLWTEGTAAQNVTLDMANCGLIRGSTAPAAHTARPFTQELLLCQRYYWKTFELDTTPAQNIGRTGALEFPQVAGASTAVQFCCFHWPSPMRVSPTITTYNPSAANAQIRNVPGASDWSGTNAANCNARTCNIFGTTAGGSAATNTGTLHVQAVAEL